MPNVFETNKTLLTCEIKTRLFDKPILSQNLSWNIFLETIFFTQNGNKTCFMDFCHTFQKYIRCINGYFDARYCQIRANCEIWRNSEVLRSLHFSSGTFWIWKQLGRLFFNGATNVNFKRCILHDVCFIYNAFANKKIHKLVENFIYFTITEKRLFFLWKRAQYLLHIDCPGRCLPGILLHLGHRMSVGTVACKRCIGCLFHIAELQNT